MVRTPQGVRNAFHPITGPRGLEWLNPHSGFFASSGRAEATEECTSGGEDVGGCKAQVTGSLGSGWELWCREVVSGKHTIRWG